MIGEALATHIAKNRDGRPLVDLEAGTWEVNATVVRVPGTGLVVQPRPKTEAGWRVLAVSAFAVGLIQARKITSGRVFSATKAGGPRDPKNVSGDLRQLVHSFECSFCRETG